MHTHNLRPQITVGQSDHRQLLALAAAGNGASASAGESLLIEMERARVVSDARIPLDVVRMGSGLRYRTDRDEEVEVTLVYPVDADISLGKISVLTPVGAALIGLRSGQSITYQARDGRMHVLTLLEVLQPVVEPAKA